jgi:ubiquinone/menaquinone biosynthesis C-methylase UbiE
MSYGNVAKYYVRKQLEPKLREAPSPVTIVDLGCGTGSQWQWLYDGYKDKVHFHGIEPNAREIEIARKRFPGWSFLAAPAYSQAGISADFVTSLSALEHVYRREEFLATAARLLKPGGTFFLNYDNGHFFDQGKLRVWASQLAARFGYEGHYLAFVWQEEAETLIRGAGFTVVTELNFHQATRKEFSKVIGHASQEAFHEAWLEYELRVNELLKRDADALSAANSNRIILSKLFVLKKATA